MRDERRQPRLRPVDDDASPESVRPRSWLHHPLTRKVKAMATLLGAVVAISGYLAGAGAKAIKWAGVATTAEVTKALDERFEKVNENVRVLKGDVAKIDQKLEEISAQTHALAESLKKPEHRGRKRAPATPETKEGDREQ